MSDILPLQGGPVLVTGKSGQLATSLVRFGGPRIVCVGRDELDFDQPETVRAVFERVRPAAVLNAAAWTAVDAAETEVEAATRANRDGPELLAQLCAADNIPFLHVSTDYVFSGDKGHPYEESDPVSPVTVYGRTKAEGEKAAMAAYPRTIILRTAWVYSPYGKNFVLTMLNAGAKNPTLRVVGDQKGNPTSALDLARAMLHILAQIETKGWDDSYAGIYHAAGSGETTWHGLAVATLERAATHGRPLPEVLAIATSDWPTPARRPADSRLDNSRIARVFGFRFPQWQQSLEAVVDEVLG